MASVWTAARSGSVCLRRVTKSPDVVAGVVGTEGAEGTATTGADRRPADDPTAGHDPGPRAGDPLLDPDPAPRAGSK